MRALNLTLMTDLYELTMMQGYFKNPTSQEVVFDAFYRTNPYHGGYAISCGQRKLVRFLQNYHFNEQDLIWLRTKGMSQEFCDYLRSLRPSNNNRSFIGDAAPKMNYAVCGPTGSGRHLSVRYAKSAGG